MTAPVTPLGAFTTDATLIVRTWDESLAHATGIEARDAVGRPLSDVVPSLGARGLLPRFEEVLRNGAVHVFSPALHRYLLPCAPLTPSRRFEKMQQRATLAPLRQGETIVGVLATIEDVTARLEAERDLAEALAAGRDDWATRRDVVRTLSQSNSTEFATGLVEIIKTQHHDFSLLSSSLQLLEGTGVDVSEALADMLTEPDDDLRIQAALALGHQRSARAERVLIAALDDSNSNVRFQAIESLGTLRAGGAVDQLLRVAENGEYAVAFAAVEALGHINAPGTAEKLVPLMNRVDLRLAVVHALGIVGDETAVAPLMAALHQHDDVTLDVAEAIERLYRRLEHTYGHGAAVQHAVRSSITDDGLRHLLSTVSATRKVSTAVTRLLGWIPHDDARVALVRLLAVPDARPVAVEMLRIQGAQVIDLLIDRLADEDEDVRHAVIEILGEIADPKASTALLGVLERRPQSAAAVAGALARIGDPTTFEPLLALLAHPDLNVRQTALGALNSLGHPDLPSRVEALLDSDDPAVRESAVRIAGYFAYPSTFARIIERTEDPVDEVRCAALECLPYFEDVAAGESLRRALGDSSARVREAAARALARMEDPESKAALRDALEDAAPWVRYFAARSLAEQRDSTAIPALIRVAFHDPSVPARIAAIEALAAIDPNAAVPVFVQASADPRDELAMAAVAALGLSNADRARDQLLSATRDKRKLVRAAAVRACGLRPDSATVRLLQVVAANDVEPDVRAEAIDALGAVGATASLEGDEAVDGLVAMLTAPGTSDSAAAALAHLSPPRLGALSKHVRHPAAATRRAVVDLLGRSPYSEATALLREALADPSAIVRDAAVLALGRRRHVV